jgi:hypothetical protein
MPSSSPPSGAALPPDGAVLVAVGAGLVAVSAGVVAGGTGSVVAIGGWVSGARVPCVVWAASSPPPQPADVDRRTMVAIVCDRRGRRRPKHRA